MVAQLKQKQATYTPEEYLSLEETAEFKNEYIDGEIIPMTGGTTIHNQIAGNFYKTFPFTIDDQDYYTYINDVKVWIEPCQVYTYPDVLIIEGEPIYQGNNPVVVTNPKVVIEVLSDSTANYDRTKKFGFYRSLPSLQEYILISQSAYYVEQFSKRDDGRWLFNPVEGREMLFSLTSINFQISMQDLYQRVQF